MIHSSSDEEVYKKDSTEIVVDYDVTTRGMNYKLNSNSQYAKWNSKLVF